MSARMAMTGPSVFPVMTATSPQFRQFSGDIIPGVFLMLREIGVLMDMMTGLNSQSVDSQILYFIENG